MEVAKSAGYYLEVISWENDGDNYKTKEVKLEENEIKDAIAFVSLFKSKNRRGLEYIGIGNHYQPNDVDLTIISNTFGNFLVEHPNFELAFDLPKEQDFDDEEEYLKKLQGDLCDNLHEVAYTFGLTGTDHYTRVLESAKVFYYPADVIRNDVTDSYK
jgi:hypothetical protein